MTIFKQQNIHRKYWGKILLFFTGLLALLWFLSRVIPKPSRATYPCVRASAPLAAGFIIYLMSLGGSVLFLKRFRQALLQRKYRLAIFSVLVASVLAGVTVIFNENVSSAVPFSTSNLQHLLPNAPMGEAKGIFPGRVVWVHDPEATNADCDPAELGNSYWESHNTNRGKVDEMLSLAIKELTGAKTDEAAWDSIFFFHNQQRGKGRVPYKNNEIVFIKINATSTWSTNINISDFSRKQSIYYGLYETTPQVVSSLLSQLTIKAGVPEEKIFVGDPMKSIYQDNLELWRDEFPDVNFLDTDSDYDGRIVAAHSTNAKIVYSDKGTVLKRNNKAITDYLYKIFEDAEYLLNLPALKGHRYAGVTMFAKNHFGSHTNPNAMHLHNALVFSGIDGTDIRDSYGVYRATTDMMGHRLLSGKNLVYIMDALYATYYELAKPVKWEMPPFNNHWTSSLFASFDPVAIESVGFDFLYAEFDGSNTYPAYPHMGAVDDYLEQAADPLSWPEGITYDPEGTGTAMTSLGVHEHWDSPITKRYSRNLGTGTGIELIYNPEAVSFSEVKIIDQVTLYPNPFRSGSVIYIEGLPNNAYQIEIYDLNGKKLLSQPFKGNTQMLTNDLTLPEEQTTLVYQIRSNGKLIKNGKLVFLP